MGDKHELSETDPAVNDSFDALLKRAAHVSGPVIASLGAQLHAGSVLLEGRLRVVRRIGEGGMGVVYEAHDQHRNGSVALKTLSRLDAGSVYRLKNEFRSLADVSHPNLCRLHELFGEAGQWFFTMELIHGARFDHWVRPNGALDEARLRAALPPLCDGIAVIHANGKLHRDLKPSNVLVTEDGRVVALDFGLAVDPELGGVGQTVMDESVSGTPAYMAPEQAAGLPATTASDFYALGVMLFEALTGRLPFEGRPGEMLAAKQHRDAPRASAVAAHVPEDLDALCAQLLLRDGAARPSIGGLRSVLGQDTSDGVDTTTRVRVGPSAGAASLSTAPDAALELLGREAELQALREAYAITTAGKPVVLFVAGESGMGKSALVATFLAELRKGHATVLAGRCYERENVPFKGFDSVVDELSRHLRKLSPQEAAAVLPREAFALARIFPVLNRVPVVAEAPKKDVPDPNDLKRRAFDAFGELLTRMRDRAPLVLFIDDVQWLDQDSVRFMRALFVHPDPAPVLLICAHRSERATENALLQSVLQGARDNPSLNTRTLEVGPLRTSALSLLAQRLLPSDASGSAAAAFADEARGSPFFAAELARAAALSTQGAPLPSLADAIALHIASLAPGAQRLLSVLALAGQPLSPALVVSAASLAEGHSHLDQLRSEQLVRVSIDEDGERSVECYHDKIREHVVGALDPLHVRELSLGLSRALLAKADSDPELLARCLDLAGLPEDAAVHAARAGAIAFAALAFDRAAQHFARALEHGRFEPAQAQALRVSKADALAAAGQGERAGEAYFAAAQGETDERARELTRKAGEQYLLCGNLERGRVLFGEALKQVGVRMPKTLAGTLSAVVWSRTRLRLRGLSFTPREHHDVATLRELEALHVATNCLVRTDSVRAADFCARWLVRALDAGHAVEAARALGWEILFASSTGASDARLAEICALCEQLCEQTSDPLAWQWFFYCRGIHHLMRAGEPTKALADMDRALELLTAHPNATSSYDRAWIQNFRANTMFMSSNHEQALELAQPQLEDALARGDRTVSGSLAPTVCFALLAADQPELAERLCAEAVARLPPNEVTLQYTNLIWIQPLIDVYRGRARDGWLSGVPHFERFFRSFQGRLMFRGALEGMACSLLVAASHDAKDEDERHALVREAKRFGRRADSSKMGMSPCSHVAALASLRGDRVAAAGALRQRIAETRIPVFEQATRRRLGELLGGDEGNALIAEADAAMRAGGVVRPDRYAAALMPGIELR